VSETNESDLGHLPASIMVELRVGTRFCTGTSRGFAVTFEPRNRVLNDFSRTNPEASSRFFTELEPVTLERGSVLTPASDESSFVYFVESGIVTLVGSTPGHSVGVAMVGRDGVVGIVEALGDNRSPYEWVVQVAGSANRAPLELVRRHIDGCSDLHGRLLACSQLVMHQLAQSAVCNRFHTSAQRLARWLLVMQAETDTMRFEVTHEFIAQMLGTPRSAVTQAAASLRRRRIIDYRRGVLTIRDCRRLGAASCECFDVIARGMMDN